MIGRDTFRQLVVGAASRGAIAKFARFAAIGALSGGVYALAVALGVSGFALDPRLASALGYLASLPVNFAGNRKFTFLGNGPLALELARFLLVHGANIGASVLIMTLVVRGLGFHYAVGIADPPPRNVLDLM